MRRLFVSAALFAVCLAGFANLSAADEKESRKVTAMRKLLKETKLSVEYKDTTLSDVLDDLKEQIKDKTKKRLFVRKDNAGGVSNNCKFTYKADDKPLDVILDELFKQNDLGYYVETSGAYEGGLKIVKGKARGYPPKKDD